MSAEYFEIEERRSLPVEDWRVEARKEEPYREELKWPVVWNYGSVFKRPGQEESALLRLIADSKTILECRDDSDDRFVPYSEETLDRAIKFLTGYFKLASGVLGASAPLPKLLPGPSGSIDVHWKNDRKELLVNIPADKNAPALFYGDDYDKLFIKGSMDTVCLRPSILLWLLTS